MSGFPTRIRFDEALAIIQRVAASHRLAAERLAISRAHGRMLARDVVASMPLPSFDNSAMDGFAFRHADVGAGETRLRLIGEQFAGRALDLECGRGECIRITTGAPMPACADTVVMKERVRIEGDHVVVEGDIKPGTHVRRAGEDVRVGDVVMQAGTMLTPARISLAASLGVAALDVSQRPTVAVFTTGDELVEPGMPLQPGEIHDSNRELLMGLLRCDGLEPTAWPSLPDDPVRMASMLRDAAGAFDVVITCGAVSAGERDHIPELLMRDGRVHFWKVSMKPGMPVLLGQLARAQFLGLPGNPVSVFATYLTLGRALLDGMQGRAQTRAAKFAELGAPWRKTHDRREFLRGALCWRTDGTLCVQPNPADGSHRMRAAADSDALIVLEDGLRDYALGDVVEVLLT